MCTVAVCYIYYWGGLKQGCSDQQTDVQWQMYPLDLDKDGNQELHSTFLHHGHTAGIQHTSANIASSVSSINAVFFLQPILHSFSFLSNIFLSFYNPALHHFQLAFCPTCEGSGYKN